jgi:hypothetical protein
MITYLLEARVRGQPRQCGPWIRTGHLTDKGEVMRQAALLSEDWVDLRVVVCSDGIRLRSESLAPEG